MPSHAVAVPPWRALKRKKYFFWLIFMEAQSLIFSLYRMFQLVGATGTRDGFISGGVFLCLWCGLLLHSGCSPRFYTEVHAATLNCVDSLEDKERRRLDFCSRSHVAWFFTLKKPNTFFKKGNQVNLNIHRDFHIFVGLLFKLQLQFVVVRLIK